MLGTWQERTTELRDASTQPRQGGHFQRQDVAIFPVGVGMRAEDPQEGSLFFSVSFYSLMCFAFLPVSLTQNQWTALPAGPHCFVQWVDLRSHQGDGHLEGEGWMACEASTATPGLLL